MHVRPMWILFFTILFTANTAFGEDFRKGPIDLYLLIDTSASISAHYGEALSWVRRTVLDEILQKDDTVTIISAGSLVQLVTENRISGPESTTDLAKTLQSISIQGNFADLAGAIREAKKRDAAKAKQQTMAIALIITGTDSTGNSVNLPKTKELEALLKYSKVEDFPGWKVIIIGLNLEAKIQTAAKEYQAFVDTLQQKTP